MNLLGLQRFPNGRLSQGERNSPSGNQPGCPASACPGRSPKTQPPMGAGVQVPSLKVRSRPFLYWNRNRLVANPLPTPFSEEPK